MNSTPMERRKNTLSSIFLRKGGNGAYTRLFENLEPSQQSALLAAIDLRPGELPVVGSLRSQNNWLILTMERLVWRIDGAQKELPIESIGHASLDLRKLQDSHQTKLTWPELRVETMAGEEHVIELEPGRPLTGVWNILLNLSSRNRNRMRD